MTIASTFWYKEGIVNTLVAYFSQTGKTKQVAEAIFEALPEDKEIKAFDELDGLDEYDLVFVGFPIIAFGPAPAGKDFLSAKAKDKQVALFITHAAPEDQEGIGEWLEKCRDAAADTQLIGLFDCMGELSEQIADYLLKSDDPIMRSFGERRGETLGQPDAARLRKARDFAKEMVEKARA